MIPKHLLRFPTYLKAVHKVGLAIWPCVCLYPERRNVISSSWPHSMDVYKVILELHKELEKVDLAIESLEGLMRSGTLIVGTHRGRKSMAKEERRIVSERMKKYWANRRKPRS